MYKSQVDGARSVRVEQGQGVHHIGHVVLNDQPLNLGEHGPEQISHGKPEIDADIAGQSLDQRIVEAVEHADGKGQRPQHREYDQKEGSYCVHD